MQRALLAAALLIAIGMAALVMLFTTSGDFVESSEQTLFGADIGFEERQAVQQLTGLELPPASIFHAYHFESALDQRMVALVSMREKDAEAFLAHPLLVDATWDTDTGLPTAETDLAEWPSNWGEPTASGRRAFIEAAPGRYLGISIAESTSDTRTLQITWTTY